MLQVVLLYSFGNTYVISDDVCWCVMFDTLGVSMMEVLMMLEINVLL